MENIRSITFDNGLRLLVCRISRRHTVSVNVRVNAGTRMEDAACSGMAHFVEHVLFQGTTSLPSNYLLTRAVESLGGEMSGATHTEYTSYWLNVPGQFLTQALPVFFDMLSYPHFTAENIEKEKSVIIDEIAENAEEGWMQAQHLLDQAVWSDHPLARSMYGTEEAIRAFTYQGVQAFFARHYTPDNMVFAVVGDVDYDEVVDLFKGYWAERRPGHLSPLTLDEYEKRSPRPFLHQAKDNGLLHLFLGFKTPPLHDARQGNYLLLRTLLGEGMSSRFYTALRGDSGLCYTVDCYIDELRSSNICSFYIIMHPDNVITVFEKVCAILADICTQPISAQELEHCRGQALGKLLREADDLDDQARMLSLSTFLGGATLTLDEQIAQIAQADVAQLQEAARQMLHPDNRYMALVGPLSTRKWQRCQQLMRFTLPTEALLS